MTSEQLGYFIFLILIGIIAGLIFSFPILINIDYEDLKHGRFYDRFHIVMASIIMLLWITGSLAIGILSGGKIKELGTAEEITPIYALQDNYGSSLSGTVFLGTGSITTYSGPPVYVYVEETEYGKHVTKIQSSNVYLQTIEDDETPCLVTHYITYSCVMHPDEEVRRVLDYYEFRIPEGSIDYSYNIDLADTGE